MIASIWKGETPESKAIRKFAGDDVEKTFYYPEDREYLLSMEPEVEHYEVLHALHESEITS